MGIWKYNSYWPEQRIPVSLMIYLSPPLFRRVGLYKSVQWFFIP